MCILIRDSRRILKDAKKARMKKLQGAIHKIIAYKMD